MEGKSTKSRCRWRQKLLELWCQEKERMYMYIIILYILLTLFVGYFFRKIILKNHTQVIKRKSYSCSRKKTCYVKKRLYYFNLKALMPGNQNSRCYCLCNHDFWPPRKFTSPPSHGIIISSVKFYRGGGG